jgi:hypothetical protein
MPESLMKSPHELKAFLASRTVLDPLRELDVLTALLESIHSSNSHGRAQVEMLEVLWPSVNGLIELFERQINGSWQRQCYAENASFDSFERLTKLALKCYSTAAIALHRQLKPWWGRSPREIALNRAINLSAQLAVMRLSLYIPIETGYWHDLYALWQEAEHAGFLSSEAKLTENSPLNSKLGEILIGLAVLATLPTNALPAQEIRPLLACFVHFSAQTQVSKSHLPTQGEWISLSFENDTPPKRFDQLLASKALAATHVSRFITIEPLLKSMQDILNNVSSDFVYFSECAVLISRATLERVIKHLELPIKPRHDRPKIDGYCTLRSGFADITRYLQEDIMRGATRARSEPGNEDAPRLVEEGIDTPPDATNLIEAHESSVKAEELWDLVARGHLIYETPLNNDEDGAQTSTESTRQQLQTWEITDVSTNGIRLSGTRGKNDLPLSIGGLVLVEFPANISIDYMIGILRWELNPDAATHEIGIETLTHQALPLRVSGSHQDTSQWHDALLLPPSRQSKQALLVLPNQEYRLGATVMALMTQQESDANDNARSTPMLELSLGHKIMQTSSICVFQFQDARAMAPMNPISDPILDTPA